MIKYICVGGRVISRSDGDDHIIHASRLPGLYNVPTRECTFITYHDYINYVMCRGRMIEHPTVRQYPDAIILYPDQSGEYKWPGGNE